jgi:mono/diheme cytochrome c family protein
LEQRRNAGVLAVLFGHEGGFPHINGRIVLPSGKPDSLSVRYIVGADENDMMSYAMAVGDVDGDGIIDIAPNGMGGDGAYNTLSNTGEIYVISGAEFLSPKHDLDGQPSRATPVVQTLPTNTPPVLPDFDTRFPGNPALGFIYYHEVCAGCHGPGGSGEGVGLALVGTEFIQNISDEDLLYFLQVGRFSDNPDNTTGVIMPPYGGRVDWGPAEMWDIIAYIRRLNAD